MNADELAACDAPKYEELVEARYIGVYGEGDECTPPAALFKTIEEAEAWCKARENEYGKCWHLLRTDVAGSYWNSFDDDPRAEFISPIAALDAENRRMQAILNTPEIKDFLKAVEIEAAHQRNRWGDAHDEQKDAGDWAHCLPLILSSNQAVWERDRDKYLHHLITMAAICFNAHRCTQLKAKNSTGAKRA